MAPLPYFLIPLFLISLQAYAKPPVEVEFPEAPPSSSRHVVQDNFIGISWELSSFDTLWGRRPDRLPNPMINYMHNIRDRMFNPLRIRVGGNGMDGSTWVSTKTDTMLEITDDSYYNDIPVNFGPLFFDVLNSMSSRIGSIQVIIGLSMRDPENDENVIQLALAAKEKLGDSLDALLLGNEPDLYQGHENREVYNLDIYIPEVRSMMEDFEEAGLLDRKLIGGPTTCCRWPLDEVLDAGLDQFNYKYYTIQHYPNHACSGENEKNTNITFYLTHTEIDAYVNWDSEGVNQAVADGTDVLLSEFNSVACGGSRISNTFAMSLWSIDVVLKAAASNYSAAYIHTREYQVQYNLFDPPESSLTNPEEANLTTWRTGSPYYSTLFLAEAFGQDGSVVVDLNLNDSSTDINTSIATYGIYDHGGDSRGKLALINYNYDHSITQEQASSVERSPDDVAQVFRLPAGLASSVQYRILDAPTIWEDSRISWAGQRITENGALTGNGGQLTTSIDCADGCEITVPGPGAALVFLEESSIYFGNSTLVGEGSAFHQNSAAMSKPTVLGTMAMTLVGVMLTKLTLW